MTIVRVVHIIFMVHRANITRNRHLYHMWTYVWHVEYVHRAYRTYMKCNCIIHSSYYVQNYSYIVDETKLNHAEMVDCIQKKKYIWCKLRDNYSNWTIASLYREWVDIILYDWCIYELCEAVKCYAFVIVGTHAIRIPAIYVIL